MAKSKLIVGRSKKSTILVSKRTVEDAIRRANNLASTWMETNPNDPRTDELQNVVDHLSSILNKTPQEMRAEGASTIEDYFDDAKLHDQANVIKREVNMIAKWHDEGRAQHAQPKQVTPEQQGVGYVPDSAVSVMSSEEEKVMADKQACAGAAFTTDRDEKGEAKAPEKLEVPRLAAKKKKEAEDPAAAGAPPVGAAVPAPAAPAAGGGAVNPIEYIPTETLIKVIEDMPKEEDFAQNKNKQDALIALTEILKARPVLAPEPDPAAAAAAPAPVPVAASAKKADLGDHAVGGGGSISNHGGDGGSAPSAGSGSTPQVSTNPAPAKAKIDLGGLTVAGSLEDEKTADDYRIHDYKLQDEGIVPTGKLPGMDEQEQNMHPEEESQESRYSSLKKAIAAVSAEVEKLASGAAGGAWSNDHDEKGNVLEDGGRTPEVAEAHGMLDEAPAKLDRPESTNPMKFAADMTTSKALKQSESLGNDLKKLYLDAKALTQVNDTRPVREAVEAIFRAADMFDEATKALNKQNQQEESEAAAQEIKAKNKKSSFDGLALAAAE